MSMYTKVMDVGIAQLRRELKRWIDAVEQGEEIVVTDRGRPVAKLVRAGLPEALERLIREGLVTLPDSPTQPASRHRRVRARGSAAEEVIRQRGR